MTEAQLRQFIPGDESTLTQPGTHGEQGTGLGLIICSEFIRLHGSQLKAISSPDKGTTISFDLPGAF